MFQGFSASVALNYPAPLPIKRALFLTSFLQRVRRQTHVTGFLFAACAGACAGPPEDGPVIEYDPCQPTLLELAADANESERAAVATAVELWAQAGGPSLTVEAGTGQDGAQVLPIGFQPAAPVFFGLYRPERGDIVINRQLSDPRARAITVAHEIGHAFGLMHVRDHRSLMNPGNLQIPPSQDEARQIYARQSACPGPGSEANPARP
jgi:IrrE N-terminal-like domain